MPQGDFVLVLKTALPEGRTVSQVDMNPNVTAIRVGTTAPAGGFGGLSVGYGSIDRPNTSSDLATPVNVYPLGHVEVWERSAAGFLVYEGRIADYNQPGGREVTAFTANGYQDALNDIWYYNPNTLALPVSGGDLLREVIRDAAPLLKVGNASQFMDPGGSYKLSDQHARYPAQAVDQVVKAGANHSTQRGDLRQIVFLIYEDRVCQLLSRACPVDDAGRLAPQYQIAFDRDVVVWQESARQLIGSASVQFTPSGGSADATPLTPVNTLFARQYPGLQRAALIPNSVMDERQAELFATNYVEKYSVTTKRASLALDPDHPIYSFQGGAPMPIWRIRAGEWVRIGTEQPLMIDSTDADLQTGRVTVTLSNVS